MTELVFFGDNGGWPKAKKLLKQKVDKLPPDTYLLMSVDIFNERLKLTKEEKKEDIKKVGGYNPNCNCKFCYHLRRYEKLEKERKNV